jgi:hypothetical protein
MAVADGSTRISMADRPQLQRIGNDFERPAGLGVRDRSL